MYMFMYTYRYMYTCIYIYIFIDTYKYICIYQETHPYKLIHIYRFWVFSCCSHVYICAFAVGLDANRSELMIIIYMHYTGGLDASRSDLMHYADAQFYCKRAPNSVATTSGISSMIHISKIRRINEVVFIIHKPY